MHSSRTALRRFAPRALAAALSLTLAASAFAFADDDARRAILDLRETVRQLQSEDRKSVV